MKHFSIKMTRTLLTGAGLWLLASCSLTPPKSMMDIQPGEHFTLMQPITLPAGHATQFIQFGQLAHRNSLSRFDQHCRIEIKHLADQPQTLTADTFRISKIQLGEEQIASRPQHLLAMAESNVQTTRQPRLEHLLLAQNSNDSEPAETMDLVHLYLTPTAQNPNILRLTCAGSLSNGSLNDAPRSYRPQRQQINDLLGSYGKITP